MSQPPHSASTSPDGKDAVIALWLVTAHLVLIIGAFTLFRRAPVLPGGTELSVPRCLFNAVNSATLTGFQQSTTIAEFRPIGQAAFFFLTLAGTWLALGAGGLAVNRIAALGYSTSRVLVGTAVLQAVMIIAGAALMIEPGRSLWSALFTAASAFGNSGLMIGPQPLVTEWRAILVLMPLAALGGLGVVVILNALDALRGREEFRRHSSTVLVTSAGAMLIGLWGGLLVRWLAGPIGPTEAAQALVGSVNARGAGLSFASDYVYSYPRTAQWFALILMAIGAAPAGAGGGLKVTTIAVAALGAWRCVRGTSPGRSLGYAIGWLGSYSLIVIVVLLWILHSAPEMPADRALFAVVSAVGNVGLSHDPLSVTAANAYPLCVAMLLGRFVPLALLWWMASSVRGQDEVAVA